MVIPRHLLTAQSALVALSCCPFPFLVSGLVQPKGSAARPLDKKKVAILGGAGSLGGLTFGFVQRACSLYGTGLGDYRTIGACSDTAARLNSYLGKHFCLGFANEANIKLTDLDSVDAIKGRLDGWDALILGSDIATQTRKVTPGSYDRTPNDKCNEIYWKAPPTLIRQPSERPIVANVVSKVLEAAKEAGVQHIVFVDETGVQAQDSFSFDLVENCGIPYTRIQPAGELVNLPDYTYRKGVQGQLVLNQATESGGAYEGRSYEEDVAALAVQCLLSLDWNKSRSITVSTSGPATEEATSKNPKRPDQEWCVNSFLLAEALAGIE